MKECPKCHGDGELYYRGWRNDPELDELVKCDECNGTGEIDEESGDE